MTKADWLAYLGARGARVGGGAALDFGDPGGELAAAREASIVAPLTPFALLECAGEDAQTFLHNQLTSDVKHLAADGAQYAAWCSPKGRMLASFLLFRQGGGYRALLSADLLEPTLERLRIYVLRSKVTLAGRADAALVGVSGPSAWRALQNAGLLAPESAMTAAAFDGGAVIRLDARRFIVAAESGIERLWPALAEIATPAGAPVWQWLDIAAGIPWIAAATREAFVPQMADFDRLGGVSFRKGCYPGQEVVARAQYLGKVKRHLYRVHADGPLAPGAAVDSAAAPNEACGQIVNAAPAPGGGHDALAVLLEDAAAPLRAAQPDGGSIGLHDAVRVFATESTEGTERGE